MEKPASHTTIKPASRNESYAYKFSKKYVLFIYM